MNLIDCGHALGVTRQTLKAMKITFLLLTGAFLQVGAKGVAQNVTYSGKNVKLETVFNAVEQQTGYAFFYNDRDLKKANPISVDLKNAALEDALAIILKNQPLSFSITGKTIVIKEKPSTTAVFQPADNSPSLSPPIDITGKVTDADGNPLVGASVKVRGSSNGTTTNNDGVFTLKGVDENAMLEISYVGYETYTVAINNKTAIVASLKIKPESLNEVVINKGYYTERQKLSTANVSTVKSADIQKQPVNNPLLALEGRVPGLEIIQASGVPGTAVRVRIRGQNSFSNGNEPLYIIDGVPYNSLGLPGLGNVLGAAGHNLQGYAIFGNPLSLINPADIESIDVLKDADATAIYGSRAANGAILITTKKGKASKTTVSVNAYTGWGQISRKMDLLNLQQYLSIRHEAFKNDGATPNPNEDYDLTLWDTTRYTDWQKYFIGGTANYNNVQATVSGGNAQMQYLIGGNYNKETTVFPGDFNDTKASMHFNIASTSANRKFKILLTGMFLSDNNKLMQEDLTRYIYLAPNAPAVFNADGALNWAFNSSGVVTWDNPMTYMVRKYKNITNNLIANSSIGYEVIQGLEIKANLGYTNQQSHEVATSPLSSINPNNSSVPASSNFADNSVSSWIVEPQISYEKKLGKGKLNLLVGSTFQSNTPDFSKT